MLRVALVTAFVITIVTCSENYNLSDFNREDEDLRLETYKNGDIGDGDWFVAPPLLPISVAASNYIRDQRCRNHSRLFLQQLRNFTLWAVESEYNLKLFSCFFFSIYVHFDILSILILHYYIIFN